MIAGECNRCGDCCRHFALTWPYEELTEDDEKWLKLHGIEVRRDLVVAPFIILAVPCSALTAENECSVYDERPEICRGWPHDRSDLALEPRCSLRWEEGSDAVTHV